MESLHLGIKAISEQSPNKHLGAAQMLIRGGGCARQFRDSVTIDNPGPGDPASPLQQGTCPLPYCSDPPRGGVGC